MAITDQTLPAPKGPSLVIQIGVLLVMTAAAVGLGWGAGMYLNKETKAASAAAPDAATHEAPAGHAPAGGEHGEKPAEGEQSVNALLVQLAPITTNLSAPSQVWIRLEASLVLDSPQPPEMAETVHQDLLAYLRTLKLHQIEGASGYQHLKADMEERARIRSDGHITQVLIRTLLLE